MRTEITQEDFEANFQLAVILVGNDITIDEREFNFNVVIPADTLSIRFINCLFNGPVSFSPARVTVDEDGDHASALIAEQDPEFFFNLEESIVVKNEIWFSDGCEFIEQIDLEEVTFNDKFKIHDSEIDVVKLDNAKFHSLADFWCCKFTKKITFYKTDFNTTVVFSAATFDENVLFTYTLFGGKAIFARTTFLKGFDFSQSIISGDLQFFNLKLSAKNYIAEYLDNDDLEYQNAIDTLHKIPYVNKKETFRILKHSFEKSGNYTSAIDCKFYEYQTFFELLNEIKKDGTYNLKNFGNRWILRLNKWSNGYGTNYLMGARFTVFFAALFVSLTLITTSAFKSQWCMCPLDRSLLPEAMEYFVTFLNPVHRLTYLEDLEPSALTYLFDFLGRIVVGYGIYQTVQAFRKYK